MTMLLRRWRERCSTLLVDEVQDVDRSQLDLAVLLAGDRRDIFLVGDDDQTIYAWRLADVRRVLDLAGSLPGLRRVDLVTNYRCPRPVVDRAVRLIATNRERFAKTIRAGPAAAGRLLLAPDSGDELARARRLLGRVAGRGAGHSRRARRTNNELAPFAAVALERGIAYRAAEDGLALDDHQIDAMLERLPKISIAIRASLRAKRAQRLECCLPGHCRIERLTTCAKPSSVPALAARSCVVTTPS